MHSRNIPAFPLAKSLAFFLTAQLHTHLHTHTHTPTPTTIPTHPLTMVHLNCIYTRELAHDPFLDLDTELGRRTLCCRVAGLRVSFRFIHLVHIVLNCIR